MILSDYLSKKIKNISFMSIIMVIYIHSYNINNSDNSFTFNLYIQNLFSQELFRVAVPMFFIISGFLFFRNFTLSNYNYIVKKKIFTLLIPFIFWSMIVVVIYMILQFLPFTKSFFQPKIVNYSVNEIVQIVFIRPLNYPLWFMRDLFLLTILSPFIFFLVTYFNKVYFIILFYFYFYFVFFSLYTVEAFISIESILFFSVGAHIALNIKNLLALKRNTLIMLIFIYATLIIINSIVFLYFDNNVMLFLKKISIILGLNVLWYGYDLLALNEKIMNFFIKYTFIYFVFHEPILTIIKKITLLLFERTNYGSLIAYIFAPIMAIFILTFFSKLIITLLPNFTYYVTGGRLINEK